MAASNIRLRNRDVKTRLLNALAQAAVSVLLLVLWTRTTSRSLSVLLGVAFAAGVVYFGLVFMSDRTDCYDLEVDDDAIRLLRNEVKSSVRKDRIRFVGERGGSRTRLIVSERGPLFSSWFRHRVSVPATAPEYERIKSQAVVWLENSKN
jgi:hypothetical protein